MNEGLFLLQVFLVMAFGFVALRMGQATLTAWVAFQAVLANLFALKEICFFGLYVICSDIFTIGSVLGLNLLREYFGTDSSKKALWACFFIMGFFVIMGQFHLFYQPSPLDTTQSAYAAILSPTPRLLTASLTSFLIVQHFDLRLFGALKKNWSEVPLTLRNAVSLTISQLLDTVLFTFLGLWGHVSHLFDVILISFQVKLLIIALMSPLIHFSKRFVQKVDSETPSA